jgi:4'-phosphopantetheinyl transferase
MIANGQAHVWVHEIAVDGVLTGDDYDVLSVEERAIASRFIRPCDLVRYVRSHVELRRLLAAYTGCPPDRLQFERTPAGKPSLSGGHLHFNLSHSGRCVVIGVCAGDAIGVDVEEIRAFAEYQELARRYFAPHELAWMRGAQEDQPLERFYRLWTIKEALLKATGVGVSALAEATVSDEWSVDQFDALPGYAAAAVVATGITVRWRTRSEVTLPWPSFPTSWSAWSSGSTSLPPSCWTTSERRRFEPTPSHSSSASSQR